MAAKSGPGDHFWQVFFAKIGPAGPIFGGTDFGVTVLYDVHVYVYIVSYYNFVTDRFPYGFITCFRIPILSRVLKNSPRRSVARGL